MRREQVAAIRGNGQARVCAVVTLCPPMEEGGGRDQFVQNRPKKALPAFRAQCEGFTREKQTRLGGGSYLIKDAAFDRVKTGEQIDKPETWILKVGQGGRTGWRVCIQLCFRGQLFKACDQPFDTSVQRGREPACG